MEDELISRRALAPLARRVGLPAGFARMSATEKLRVLLDLPDPGRVIRVLRPDELYALVREIGLEDAWDLVLLGTVEQKRAVRDLEVWTEDRYEPERMDRILDLSLQAGLEEGLAVVRDCDPEALALHVFAQARVTLVQDEEERGAPEEEEGPEEASFLSPDGIFRIRCENPESVPSVRRLLDLLYAEGVEFAHRILFAGRFDTPSSLEDQARHFRDKRLEDLGFPPPEERFALWEPFDLQGFKRTLQSQVPKGPTGEGPEDSLRPLALVLATRGRGSWFFEAMASIADHPALPTIAHRILYLVNKVLAARTTTFYDDEAWHDAAEHAVATLSLSLEYLTGGDRSRAGEVLLIAHPMHLYRAGIEILRPLNLIARRILREVGGLSRLVILGERTADGVRSALAFPPERPHHKEAPFDWSVDEVTQTRRSLEEILAVLRFARDHLGFRPGLDRSRSGVRPGMAMPTLANVLTTAWANHVLKGEWRIEPLTGEEVRNLLVAAFDGGRIRPSLREIRLPSSDRAGEGEAVKAYLQEALDRVEESLGRLDPGRLVDTRFLGDCLLFRSD